MAHWGPDRRNLQRLLARKESSGFRGFVNRARTTINTASTRIINGRDAIEVAGFNLRRSRGASVAHREPKEKSEVLCLTQVGRCRMDTAILIFVILTEYSSKAPQESGVLKECVGQNRISESGRRHQKFASVVVGQLYTLHAVLQGLHPVVLGTAA